LTGREDVKDIKAVEKCYEQSERIWEGREKMTRGYGT
jgi:hypothetical protein